MLEAIYLILYFFVFLFVVGIILFIIGLCKKDKKKEFKRAGLIVASLPFLFFILAILYQFFFDGFATKPRQEDLVGVYHITGNPYYLFREPNLRKYVLVLKKDGSFIISQSSTTISYCESGQYSVNYDNKLSELMFRGANCRESAHIKRSFGSYQIEFGAHTTANVCFTKDK